MAVDLKRGLTARRNNIRMTVSEMANRKLRSIREDIYPSVLPLMMRLLDMKAVVLTPEQKKPAPLAEKPKLVTK